jgi:hypothetical protein
VATVTSQLTRVHVGTYVGEFSVTLATGVTLTFPNREDDWIVFSVVHSLKTQ